MRVGPIFLNPELGRLDLAAVLVSPSRGPISDGSVQLEKKRFQAILVFNDHQFGAWHEIARDRLSLFMPREASERRVEQRRIDNPRVERLPNVRPLEGLHRANAGFASLALFGEGLQGFEGVEPIGVG